MRDITVKYTLKDEDEERLKKITEEYKKQHDFEMTEDKMFDSIMCLGSWHNIDDKFQFHERRLGLREDSE